MTHPNSIAGFRLVGNPFVTDTVLVEHDLSKFIEYDPKDYPWRLALGFIEYKTVPAEYGLRIGDAIVMHPAMLALVEAELATLSPGLKITAIGGQRP